MVSCPALSRTAAVPSLPASSRALLFLSRTVRERHAPSSTWSLHLLGLQVSTNQIVLDIVAQPGKGNLLGNLLCSITNLLNPDQSLVRTLNRLQDALGGIVSQD